MNGVGQKLYLISNLLLILFGLLLRLGINESIGDNITATGIVGIIMYWALDVTAKREKRAKELLKEASKCGIAHFYNIRLIPEIYKQREDSASGSFDIMGFGLRTFIEDNIDRFGELSKKFAIRILVLDPDSPNCSQRDYEENDPYGKIKDDVLFVTKKVQSLSNPKVHIRWYKAIPVTNVLRIGDTMFIGPYFVRTRSRNSITMEVRAGGSLFNCYLNHFNSVWDDHNLSRDPPVL